MTDKVSYEPRVFILLIIHTNKVSFLSPPPPLARDMIRVTDCSGSVYLFAGSTGRGGLWCPYRLPDHSNAMGEIAEELRAAGQVCSLPSTGCPINMSPHFSQRLPQTVYNLMDQETNSNKFLEYSTVLRRSWTKNPVQF
jgi:hypothetical protein